MSTGVAGVPAPIVVSAHGDAQRITPNEAVWVSIVVLLATLSSIDAVREIPPLGDDYWMIHKAPGAIALDYLREYGWGRPLGIALIDVLNTARGVTGASVLTVVLVMRVVTLLAVYFIFRRLFAFSVAIALFALLLVAWNPAAGEAWVLLSNLHLATSVIGALLACGLYARALGCLPQQSVADGGVEDRRAVGPSALVAPVATQIVVNLMYEQTILAVPAFVGTLVALNRCAPSRLSMRATVFATAAGAAAVCAIFMLASGYVQSRSAGITSPSAEVSDLAGAVEGLWVGFGEHHLWRLIEAVRLRRAFWWDASSIGIVAGIGTLAASAAVAWRWARDPSVRSASSRVAIAAAAFAAAYAALLPMGLAYPRYHMVSRLFYLPGAFLALSIASLVANARRDTRARSAIVVGAALMWLGMLSRRYYEDMRDGSRILRSVARAIGQMPPALRAGGVLVIAPSNVGTFSTSAVERWSIRSAVRELTGLNPEGPIFLVSDCAELEHRPPTLVDDTDRQNDPQKWSGVMRYHPSGVELYSTARGACASDGAPRRPTLPYAGATRQ